MLPEVPGEPWMLAAADAVPGAAGFVEFAFEQPEDDFRLRFGGQGPALLERRDESAAEVVGRGGFAAFWHARHDSPPPTTVSGVRAARFSNTYQPSKPAGHAG